MDDRLPTALWIEAHLRRLNAEGIPHYILNKGAYAAGMVLLKIHDLSGKSVLLTQQRDLSGDLGWTQAIAGENIEESKIDDYITRAVKRDPDLWVIEIEDRALNNPFEGKIF